MKTDSQIWKKIISFNLYFILSLNHMNARIKTLKDKRELF